MKNCQNKQIESHSNSDAYMSANIIEEPGTKRETKSIFEIIDSIDKDAKANVSIKFICAMTSIK